MVLFSDLHSVPGHVLSLLMFIVFMSQWHRRVGSRCHLQSLRGCLVNTLKHMFLILNNIIRIFTYFFTHTYFQTIKHMFLSAYIKHPLNFHVPLCELAYCTPIQNFLK